MSKNELAAAEPQNAVTTSDELSPAERMFAGMMEVIKDPAVSPEKMSAMLDVQERMIERQALMEFNAAKLAAMQEMPYIDRDGSIKNKNGDVQSRFSTFEAIDRIVRPVCMRHGLVYSFNLQGGERGATNVTCELAHVGGHVQQYGPLAVPLDASGSKNPTQGVGSSSSYGKRYTLCAALNIVTISEDNDGRTASRQISADPIGAGQWADKLVDDAQKAAANGSEAYAEFFKSLSPIKKGWIVETGKHDDFKESAAQIDELGK